jgi:hypothetical protein
MFALIKDVTPNYGTIAMLADDRDELCLTSAELAEEGLDDTCGVIEIDDDRDVDVGDRIRIS